MAQATAIGWTDLSWNPVLGCSIVSTECKNCYAAATADRWGLTPSEWTPANAAENVILKPHKLREPLSNAKAWRGLGAAAAAAGKSDGKLVFVNSMSDLFHEAIPDEYIAKVFAVMAAAPQHTFQILTKRPERMREWFAWEGKGINRCGTVRNAFDFAGYADKLGDPMARLFPWPLPNVWLGVSIGLRHFVGRADLLRQTPAAVRFISAEPLLGPLVRPGDGVGCLCGWPLDPCHPAFAGRRCDRRDQEAPELDLVGIDWLIVGGESGHGHRPMDVQWARDLRDAAQASGTAFFFKQGSGPRPGTGRVLDGRTWDEFPRAVRAVA